AIASYADLRGAINIKRPNDMVHVSLLRDGKQLVVPVTLTKSEFISAEFKGLELENIDAGDKRKFRINSGVRIKTVTNERLMQYADELEGAIILKIGNVPAVDVETVSQALSKVDENQSVQLELLTSSGQRVRLII